MKNHWPGLLFLVLALGMTTGCASRASERPSLKRKDTRLPVEFIKHLEAADQVEIVSLNPTYPAETVPHHLDWTKLGSTAVLDPILRGAILDAIYETVTTNQTTKGDFEPRYAVRAFSLGHRIDLVFCFKCRQVRIYERTKETFSSFPITEEAPAIFHEVLTYAGIPLESPEAKK